MSYVRPTLTLGTATNPGTGTVTSIADRSDSRSWSLVADGSTVHYLIIDDAGTAGYSATHVEWGLGTKTTVLGNPALTRSAGNVLNGSAGVGVLVNFTGNVVVYATQLGDVEVLPNVSADPAVASLGQTAFRTDTGRARLFVGTWGNFAQEDVANTFTVTDAATTTLTTILTLDHDSSGTPAAGFGGSQVMNLDSATVVDRPAAEWDWSWVTATDATRKSRIIGYVFDNTAAREWIRAESDGTLSLTAICGPVIATTALTVNPGADTYKGVVIRANSATQSADLEEWQTSAGAPRARITSKCEFSNPTPNDASGANNEVFGAGAGNALGTGNQNTLIGNNAGLVLSTGTLNTFIGYQCGKAATNNTNHVGVGVNALALANGGDGNTAVGVSALNTMTGASNNTAVGQNALGSVTGSGNTALGKATGGNVGTGTNCVLLGNNADAVSSNLSNVIALGGSAKAQANEFALAPTCNFQTFYVLSSTSTLRQRADFTLANVDNTDATRKYRIVHNVWDTAAREGLRLEADGTLALTAFGGAVVASTIQTIYAGNDAYTALKVRRNSATQSVDLAQWEASAGKPRARITSACEFSNPTPNDASGANNEAFGSGALAAATSGHDNTAVGRVALGALSTPIQNTAVGVQALQGIATTGNNNTGVGFQAGQSLTGASNICLGQGAGLNGAAGSVTLTTGSQNTLVGAQAGVVVNSQSNGIALGFNAVCQANEFALGPNTNFQTYYVLSSTSTLRQRADFTLANVDNTDATRKYRLVHNVWDTAAREGFRIEASGTAPMIGFLGAGAVVRQTDGAALTNNVTSGGTTDTIANYTDLSVYANDAAAIRNDIYQLARKLKIVDDALRLYGLLT